MQVDALRGRLQAGQRREVGLLGLLAGIVANSFDQMAALTNYIITPLAFLSGTFYSIHQLPEFWQKVSHIDPFYYMIDGFRYAITGHTDGAIEIGMIVLAVTNLILWFVSRRLIARGYRLKS